MKKWINTRITDVKEYYILPRRIALAYALMAFVGLLSLWLFVRVIVKEQLLREERTQVSNQVNTIGTSLTLVVNQRSMLITSVHSFVEAKISQHKNIDLDITRNFKDFDEFLSGLYTSTPGIRNIAIAPDNVMEFVYPYEENKSVLGYNPAQDERPFVREEIQRAIQTENIVLSLPYELIQGGQGLIARQAIYNNGHYWGLANVVLDVSPLIEEAGILPMPAGLELAILDQSGEVFFGSTNVFAMDPVAYDVKLPEGNWVLAAAPSAGWGARYKSIMWFYNVLGLLATVTISLIVYLSTNRSERLAHTVDLRTKELTQSNQTLINVLEGIDADVYVADFETCEILFANKHLQESFKDELTGKICFEVFRNESAVCLHCKNNKLLDSNGEPAGVVTWEDQNPVTRKWYKNADRAIHWQDGRYVHLQIATDITENRRAADAIRESEERYRNLFDSVPVGIYRSTPDGRFLDGNPALLEILGYPDQETLLAANIKDLYLDIDACERELDLIEQDDIVSNYRLKLRRYDGTVIWVQDSSNAIRDNSGKTVYYYGRLEDITDRVRAEETIQEAENDLRALLQEKDILLAEVHHRVKNNMQVIISLLGLQADEIEDEHLKAVYDESRNRIKSMTLVHEQLYHSNEYARIDFGTYIDQLATSLFNTYQIDPDKIKLHISAENIYIDLERAIPCGLLINELITNSLKYAFPNGQIGQIWIKLKDEASKMSLTYSDDGIGLPTDFDIEHTQSLGLQLVRLLTVHDLHGGLSIGNGNKKGVHFSINFPLSEINTERSQSL